MSDIIKYGATITKQSNLSAEVANMLPFVFGQELNAIVACA
jgi:hypothetical protein